jgi:uncharacterized membrane protein
MMQDSPFLTDEPPSEPLSENERLLAGFSYVSQILMPAVLPVILLLSRDTRESGFMRYHAIHSLALLVVAIIYYLGATLVYALAAMVSACLLCVLWALFLAPLGVLGYYGWFAYRGERREIPWLTQFLRDNGWV